MANSATIVVPTPASTELGRRVGKSVLWQAANTSTLRVVNFLIGLFVARIVAPYDFGVFTVAFTISTILGSLISFGFSFAIVREHDRTKQIAPTAYSLSIAMSAMVTVVMLVTAPYLTRSMGSEAATGAVRVLSLFVLMAAFSSVPVALLSRDFMQRQRFMVDSVNVASSTLVMLILIGLGHPVMGLAVSSVVGQLFVVILANRLAPEHYRPGFDWHEAKHLFHFGAPLTGSRLVALLVANIDFIIVGHLLGARQLGYYNLAFNICGWPLVVFGNILATVSTPVLSRVRTSSMELSRHLQAGLSGVTAASFLVCALLCGLAAPIIDSVYGQRWHAAWAPLAMLSIFGAAQTVLAMFWTLLVSLGMTRRLLLIQLIWIVTLGPAMYFGVRSWQTTGAGLAHAVVVTGVVLPVYLITVRCRTSVKLDWFRQSLAVPFPAAIACGAAAYGASHLVTVTYLQLVLGLAAGLSVYALLAGRWLVGVARTLRAMYWSHGLPESRAAERPPERPRTRGSHRAEARARRSRRRGAPGSPSVATVGNTPRSSAGVSG